MLYYYFALLFNVFSLLNNLLLRFTIILCIPLLCCMLIFIFFASIFCSLPLDGCVNFQPGEWNSASYADSRLFRTRTCSITERVGMWSVLIGWEMARCTIWILIPYLLFMANELLEWNSKVRNDKWSIPF